MLWLDRVCTQCLVLVVGLVAVLRDSDGHYEGYAGGIDGHEQDFYSFLVTDREGRKTSLEKFRGTVSLVVNLATGSGFADRHYRGLVKLQDNLGQSDRFQVLAFPSTLEDTLKTTENKLKTADNLILNKFMVQEENADISRFLEDRYKMNFPSFGAADLTETTGMWKFLQASSGQVSDWNFWKYLIDQNGKVLNAWGPWNDVEEIYPDVKAAVDAAVASQGAALHGPRRPGGNISAGPSKADGGQESGDERAVGPPASTGDSVKVSLTSSPSIEL